MTAPDIDAIERAAQAADWTANAASYAASWAFEKLATPAAVRALIARLREAERQRDEARAALVWRPTHRHRKRGSVYQRERDNVEIQTSRPIVEGDIISVYVGKDGKPWGRLNEEFEDGRFEALSALPPPAGSEMEGA